MLSISRAIQIPSESKTSEQQYRQFLSEAYELLKQCPLYLSPSEEIGCIELAHLVPSVPETILAIYVGVNDAVCNKGLVSPFLLRHGHNNVFVFDSQIYTGGNDVPPGTVDAKKTLVGFETPNDSWNLDWIYVMIDDPNRTPQSLWTEKGYIDMIPAKFEDFTMLSHSEESKVCIFIDPGTFDHPVNQQRKYLKAARKRGEKHVTEFTIPADLEGETEELTPVLLEQGEKLYVATKNFEPCEHAWSNLHPENKTWALVNENSAVPLDMVIAKPPVSPKYAEQLIPPRGSADMTTDWFYRGKEVVRAPLLQGTVKG